MLSLDTGRQSRLVEQTNYILRLLKKMDDMQIPRFNPVEYLKSKESVEISASSVESTGEMLRAKSPELKVAGADSKSTEIQVEILSGRASTSDRQKHEMPIWHTHSTVTGQAVREKSSSITISHGISSAKQEESIDYQKYYEAVPLQPVSVKRSKIEDAPLIESSESIIPSGTAPLVPVGGTLKSIHEITDEDKNNMTEEEYQKYYEVFMSLEQEDQ